MVVSAAYTKAKALASSTYMCTFMQMSLNIHNLFLHIFSWSHCLTEFIFVIFHRPNIYLNTLDENSVHIKNSKNKNKT